VNRQREIWQIAKMKMKLKSGDTDKVFFFFILRLWIAKKKDQLIRDFGRVWKEEYPVKNASPFSLVFSLLFVFLCFAILLFRALRPNLLSLCFSLSSFYPF